MTLPDRQLEGRPSNLAEDAAEWDRRLRSAQCAEDDRKAFLLEQARAVAAVNAPDGVDIGPIVRKSGGGLRRVYTEIEKIKKGA